MEQGVQIFVNRTSPILVRFSLLALCLADLAILAQRLRPWSSIIEFPGENTSAFDPLICIGVYTLVMFWGSGIRSNGFLDAVRISSLLGALGGLLLIAHILLPSLEDNTRVLEHLGLLLAASVLWTAACILGSKAAGHFGIGIVSGIWSAMVSALIASARILWVMSPNSVDPPIRNNTLLSAVLSSPPTMSLSHGLTASTGFLLICPLAGLALGLICAFGLEN